MADPSPSPSSPRRGARGSVVPAEQVLNSVGLGSLPATATVLSGLLIGSMGVDSVACLSGTCYGITIACYRRLPFLQEKVAGLSGPTLERDLSEGLT